MNKAGENKSNGGEEEGGGRETRNEISVRKLLKPGRRSKTIGEFPPAPTITAQNKRYNTRTLARTCARAPAHTQTQKDMRQKENKYRGNMEEAPCGLIIRATPQVLYSLTAALYKFCHLVKTVRTADPPPPPTNPPSLHPSSPPSMHRQAPSVSRRRRRITPLEHIIQTACLS